MRKARKMKNQNSKKAKRNSKRKQKSKISEKNDDDKYRVELSEDMQKRFKDFTEFMNKVAEEVLGQ